MNDDVLFILSSQIRISRKTNLVLWYIRFPFLNRDYDNNLLSLCVLKIQIYNTTYTNVFITECILFIIQKPHHE